MSDPNSPSPPVPQVLERAGDRIAYHRMEGRSPGVVFLGGFLSDMTGTKAMALEARCRRHGQGFLRFDYYGHGVSSGAFADGTIGRWAEDAILVLDRLTEGPQVLVGSSMGGWIMLLAALARPARVCGLVGVAAAPDFTEDLIWAQLNEQQRAAVMEAGVCYLPGDYGEEPYPVTRRLIEEARGHLLLRAPIALTCPVALVQGMQDREVPFETAIRLAERLASDDVTVTLVKDGDHRMSEPRHLEHLYAALESVLSRASPAPAGC
jgi:pimeloyl-ACP methyl ester carboxylesterase